MEEDRIYLEEVSKEEYEKQVNKKYPYGYTYEDVKLEDIVSQDELEGNIEYEDFNARFTSNNENSSSDDEATETSLYLI